MGITLTDRKLKSLKSATPGQRYDVMDSDVRGLGIRVTDKGQRSFIFTARYPGSSNPTRRALGEYPTLSLEKARKKARAWRELIEQGIDPKVEGERQRRAELRKHAHTFKAVAEAFISRVAVGPNPAKPKQRRGLHVARELRSGFSTRWAGRPISSIDRRDVIDAITEIVDRGTLSSAQPVRSSARNVQLGGGGLRLWPGAFTLRPHSPEGAHW